MQNLKSKYEQKEMRISDDLWERLEEKLNQASAKEKKPKIFWLRYAAVILLTIGLGGSFLMINHKSNIKDNQEFAGQTKNQNQTLNPNKPSKNNEVEKLIPMKNNSENANRRLAVEHLNSSTSESINKKIQTSENISEKEISVHKEELNSVTQPDGKLTENEPPRTKVKYVSSADLLFGIEMDKAKTETPKTALGINFTKPKNESDFLNPKRIKLFGITLYEKDSVTNK